MDKAALRTHEQDSAWSVHRRGQRQDRLLWRGRWRLCVSIITMSSPFNGKKCLAENVQVCNEKTIDGPVTCNWTDIKPGKRNQDWSGTPDRTMQKAASIMATFKLVVMRPEWAGGACQMNRQGNNTGNSRNGSYPKKSQNRTWRISSFPFRCDRNASLDHAVPKHESHGLSIKGHLLKYYISQLDFIVEYGLVHFCIFRYSPRKQGLTAEQGKLQDMAKISKNFRNSPYFGLYRI